ncbi:ankyrin repeat domain-containing protein 50-like isoform X2 [Portunus trituberculatus]|uniref:ankyrin repeat domain-containing protein 50-like isoform X2 n=1 Tax=Portunus trituberculatus TaxID=210409 RepID=UPI001E1D1954|nr:ankyrin repeat domain-containing protein 50-like isoform X2 [Portunus trituberculatus]
MPLVKTAVQPGPNPACAGSTSPGDHMDDSTTVIKRTRTPSPGSDSLKDEMEMVEQFVKEFKHRYSGPHKHLPAFEKDTLENILRKAKNCSPREKPLAIYMHHDRNENFSSDVLCSNCVAAYLNGNFVVWGWDLTSSKQIHRVTKPIRGYVSPSLSMKIKNAGDNRLPLLLTICYTSWGPEVLSYIHGTSSVSDVMNCLTISKRVFDDNLSIELQKLEESECKKTASWSIPWKEENNATLEPSREDKAKLKLRETHKKEVEETRKKELLQAMSSGDLNTIQKIHDQGGDLKILVKTAHQGNVTWCLLTLAAYDGHTHLIQPLLDAGLNVDGDHQKESGFFEEFTTSWTPLMVAARQGHVRMIEELLSCGANPLAKDQKGATALHHAAFCGHVACVRVLRSWTSPAITDNSGRTPIHAACLRGHLPVIKLLAESGWKLDAVDEENNTALHMSSWYGSLEVVKYLYRADSNVNPYKKNRERLTPFDYAVREGHHHIERWFMKMQGSHSMNLNYTHHLIVSHKVIFTVIFFVCWE